MLHGSISEEVRHHILEFLVGGGEHARKDIIAYIHKHTGKKYHENIYSYCFTDLLHKEKIKQMDRGVYTISKDYIHDTKKSTNAKCADILEKTKDALIKTAKGVDIINATDAEKRILQHIRTSLTELDKLKKLFK